MRPALLALVVLLAACTPAATPHRFRVATDPHHTPLSFRDDANQTVGYEIDLIRAVAQNRGWDLELVEASATGLIRDNRDQGMLARLEKGEFDAVISSVIRSNRLLERWSVSAPYLNAGPVAVVRRGTAPVRWDGTWEGSLGVVE